MQEHIKILYEPAQGSASGRKIYLKGYGVKQQSVDVVYEPY